MLENRTLKNELEPHSSYNPLSIDKELENHNQAMKKPKLLFLILLQALYILFQPYSVAQAQNFSCATVTEIPVSECEALVRLYNSTGGPNWTRTDGWLTLPTPCSWFGVTCSLGHIDEIYLHYNNLVGEIPDNWELPNLRTLILTSNPISQIPDQWSMPNLYELRLSENQILQIPDRLAGLENLAVLLLNDNQISEIPAQWNMPSLNHLNLSGNQISQIPDRMIGLEHLGSVSLGYNQISRIPDHLTGLENLVALDLTHNQVTQLPDNTTGLENLRHLYLNNSQVSVIPDNLTGLESLSYLYLNDNQIIEIPAHWNMPNLFRLELNNNQISQIPDNLTGLRNLDSLHLNNNQISVIPDNLTGLESLSYLYLNYNQISTIPTHWKMPNLKQLDLSSNNIGQIPAAFSGLANLRWFLLGNSYEDNQLITNEKAFTITTNSYYPTNLDESGNHIEVLDLNLNSLPSLSRLYLDGNRLSTIQLSGRNGSPYLEVSYNALDARYISPDVQQLLIGPWVETQTVAPTDLQYITSTNTLDISWQAIPYLEDGGHYEVGIATTPCTVNCANHYRVVATTSSKTTTSAQINLANLLPNTTYYLAVRSHTRAHGDFYSYDRNPNPLTSQYSEPVPFVTPSSPPPEALVLYALSFDNDTTEPCSLAGYYPEVQAKILEQSAQSPTTRIAMLVDLAGNNNTHIFVAQAGRQIPFDRETVGLPNEEGILDSTLKEYDMTNPEMLGGFIRWARQAYDDTFPHAAPDPLPTQAQATIPTFFSFVGHGLPLAPQDSSFGQTLSLQQPTKPTVDPFDPLPSFRGSHPCWTDETIPGSSQHRVLTPNQLATALAYGTYDGAYPLKLVDVSHCFAASYETFYDLSNPDGLVYAEALVGSPNYSYFAPELMAALLDTVDPTLSGQTLATNLVQNYDRVFTQNPEVVSDKHPRIYVAVDSAALQATKPVFDTLVDAIWVAGNDARLLRAYQNVGYYYDTTFCAPQDWQLAPGDGLVDLYKFILALHDSYGSSSGVGVAANEMANKVAAAVLANSATNGVPWFADPPPTQPMRFAAKANNVTLGVGLGFYADLQGVPNKKGNIQLSFPAYWYTSTARSNAHILYALVDKKYLANNNKMTWADILKRYWQANNLFMSAPPETICLPDLPPVIETGETGFAPGYPKLLTPAPDTMTVNSPVTLSTAIHVAQDVHNMLVDFEVFDAATNERVFFNHASTGFLPAGSHRIKASKQWTPKAKGIYTIRITLDADKRVEETNENDNVSVQGNQTVTTEFNRATLSVTPLDTQWVDTPSLTIMVSQDADTTIMTTLFITIKQYEPSGNPNVQIPVTKVERAEIPKTLTTTPQAVDILLAQYPNLKSGITVLEIDAGNSRDTVIEPVSLRFNYLRPDDTKLSSREHIYFLFDAHRCESFSLTTVDLLNSNNTLSQSELVAWAPYNYQAPLYQPGNGNPLTISPTPHDGTYVIRLMNWGDDELVYALEPVHEALTCPSSMLAQRNLMAGSYLPQAGGLYGVEDLRPFFIEPIPNRMVYSAYIPFIANR